MSEDEKKYIPSGAVLGTMEGFEEKDPKDTVLRDSLLELAKLQRIRYETLVKAGFSKSEALFLCKESLK